MPLPRSRLQPAIQTFFGIRSRQEDCRPLCLLSSLSSRLVASVRRKRHPVLSPNCDQIQITPSVPKMEKAKLTSPIQHSFSSSTYPSSCHASSSYRPSPDHRPRRRLWLVFVPKQTSRSVGLSGWCCSERVGLGRCSESTVDTRPR